MEMKMESGFMGIKELAKYTSLSESTLRGLLSEIPHIRIRRKILVKRTDFDYWAKRRQTQHRNENPAIRKLADEIMGGL
jgi:excisionase family DNA binding protein